MKRISLIGLLLALAGCSPSAGDQNEARPEGADYLVYVSNEQSGDISIIEPVSRVQIGRIAIGKRPRGLVASPDGRLLYVAVSGSPIAGPGVDESKLAPPDKTADGIAIIDLAKRAVIGTLRGISDPEQIAISPDGERLYVASEDTGQLIVIARDGRLLHRLNVGGEPEGVTVSADGKTLLSTSEEDHSIALVRSGPVPVVSARIVVGERPRNAAFLPGDRAIVPGEMDASLSIVDLRAGKRLRVIDLEKDDRPMGVAVAADGTVLVTTGRGGRLLRIDPRDAGVAKPVLGAVTVGKRPWGVALSPDSRLAFTANGPGDDVAIVDIATMRVIGRIRAGSSPWGVVAIPR